MGDGAVRWRRDRLWAGLLLLWFASMTLAGAARDQRASESGAVTLVMLVFLVVCMATAREWSIWKRVFLVLGSIPGQAVLQAVCIVTFAGLLIGAGGGPLDPTGSAIYLDRLVASFASLPFVLWGMRRSRLFSASVVHASVVTQ